MMIYHGYVELHNKSVYLGVFATPDDARKAAALYCERNKLIQGNNCCVIVVEEYLNSDEL